MILHFASGILVYCSILVGTFLSFIAPEEVHPGKHYFQKAYRILIGITWALIIVTTIYATYPPRQLMELFPFALICIFTLASYYFLIPESRHQGALMVAGVVLGLEFMLLETPFFLVSATIVSIAGVCKALTFATTYIKKEKVKGKKWDAFKLNATHHMPFLLAYFLGIALSYIL